MKKNKKRKTRVQNKNNFLIIITILITISIFLVCFFNLNKKDKEKIQEEKNFIGSYLSANQAANWIDYLYEEKNIVISPFNVNSTLSYIYNVTDNNSYKEIKKIIKSNPKDQNTIMNSKISSLSEDNKKNEHSKFYEALINQFFELKYNELTTNDISLLNDTEKLQILELVTKIKFSYDLINDNTNHTEKSIKNYKLTKEEINYNNYVIKSRIDTVLDNYESYINVNEVKNYHKLYYDANKISKPMNEETTTILKDIYNVELSKVDYNLPEEVISLVNNDIKLFSKDAIKRVVDFNIIGNANLLSINSLYFNYKWETPFKNQNNVESFYNYKDDVNMVQMMYSIENVYLENKYAHGFIKNFENNKYSFIGIMPKKSNNDFKLSSLDIDSLLQNRKEEQILIGIPEFDYQSSNELIKLFSKIGINEIATSKANLSKLSSSDIYLSTITQKLSIQISEKGTINKTINMLDIEPFGIDTQEKQLIFNRPFCYLIINNETNDILLIGKVIEFN